MTDTQHAVRRPGGRSARVRRSVLDATLAVLRDGGWDRFSVAEVASRAGVHETSIYRRWGTRERLATDALLADGEQHLPVPDTGSLRGDLAGFAAGICQYMSTPLGLALAHALATPTGDPAITEASARYFQTRFEIASTIVDRAIARGEIPEGADGALAIEMLIAPLHFRTLVSHQPLDDGLPARLADLVIAGLHAHVDATPQPGSAQQRPTRRAGQQGHQPGTRGNENQDATLAGQTVAWRSIRAFIRGRMADHVDKRPRG